MLAAQPVIQHPYEFIASVGQPEDKPLFVAYVAGETHCREASDFACYVFEFAAPADAKQALDALSEL